MNNLASIFFPPEKTMLPNLETEFQPELVHQIILLLKSLEGVVID